MVHAYLAILTGSGVDEDEFDEGFDGGHGRQFQRCLYAVNSMTRELLGIAVSDDKEQKSSDGLLRKPFDAETYLAAPPRTSRLSRLISKRRAEREDSEPERSDRGDSEPGHSDGGKSVTVASDTDVPVP